ncbi:MAG: aspartate kinase, partial [Muribaculaceae bacterium]|nr:aspartate kinase [Muribaculaceae bacterium]
MKVLKFGGTSVGSVDRMKHVASLILPGNRNVVVLSAMSGTTNSLVEIAEYLFKGNVPGAQETINALEAKYAGVTTELLSTEEWRSRAAEALARIFALLRSYLGSPLTSDGEKEILAQGELMSTALMQCYLLEKGVKSVLLPALDYMRTMANGEPDMAAINNGLRRLIGIEQEAEIFLTQGYI